MFPFVISNMAIEIGFVFLDVNYLQTWLVLNAVSRRFVLSLEIKSPLIVTYIQTIVKE